MKTKIAVLMSLSVLAVSIIACAAPQTPTPDTTADRTPTVTPQTTDELTATPTPRPTASPTPCPTPTEVARIQFAPGATSETFDAHLDPGEVERYLLHALAGQVMHVRVTSAEESVRLRVEAPPGTPLEGRAAGSTFWRGPLPVTQDYTIVVSSEEAADYELSVIVYARIAFEQDETSATRNGHLRAHQTDHYVLHARKGQTSDVTVEAPELVGLSIVGADGVPLKRYVDEETSWRGELPLTQDYFIEVNTIAATDYTLTVSLTPLPSEASVEVVSPNGGEQWLEGSTHDIVWRSSGVEKTDVEIASGGKPLGHVALDVDGSLGLVVWRIPVGLVSNFGVAESDAMRVRISSSDDPDLYDENDEPFTVGCPRIQLQPAAASATVTGTLTTEGDQFRYALDGVEGEAMEVDISPAEVSVSVWGAQDGSTWELPEGESRLTIPSLPVSQDYFISLTSTAGSEPVDYTLEIAIR